ncbi:MAG TPA: hypothetical protein VFY39_13035, partial [Gammaproteobacteria bacterium]|nr:hypothetical protein [Gammaproteobacteria bacterium]
SRHEAHEADANEHESDAMQQKAEASAPRSEGNDSRGNGGASAFDQGGSSQSSAATHAPSAAPAEGPHSAQSDSFERPDPEPTPQRAGSSERTSAENDSAAGRAASSEITTP